MNKNYTISDKGGIDALYIEDQNRSNFRFYFDVNSDGKIVGKDLYIIYNSSGEDSRFNTFFVSYRGNIPDNFGCIKIEDYFANGTNSVTYGTGIFINLV